MVPDRLDRHGTQLGREVDELINRRSLVFER